MKRVNRLQEDQVQLLEELSDLSDVSAANPAPGGLTHILKQLRGVLHPSGDNSDPRWLSEQLRRRWRRRRRDDAPASAP